MERCPVSFQSGFELLGTFSHRLKRVQVEREHLDLPARFVAELVCAFVGALGVAAGENEIAAIPVGEGSGPDESYS